MTEVDYDARGQRLRCVHGNGTTASYAYEPETYRLSRMRLVRTSDDAVLQDLRYTYDPVGNIVEIRDGAQQRVYFDNDVVGADQRFEYDALYRLSFASGRELRSLSQPTDADLAFGPQPHADDPAALRTYEETYAWDAVGNIVELRHVAAGGNFTRRYAYATGGNRLLRNSAPGEAAEPFSHSYAYDEHGNMTGMPHLAAMAWDHADRLQHCDLGGGGEVWFVYDASGARVRKVQRNASGSRVRERVYLGEFELYRERAANDVAPELERETLHVGDGARRLCLVETLTVDDGEAVAAPVSVPRFQHGNHLDSAALELDGEAAVISYEEFHPFGSTSYAANDAAVEVSAKRYRYISKERDEETGLYHLGARYYASWLGRWTAADPIGLGDHINRYCYAHDNPVGLSDRTGMAAAGETLWDRFTSFIEDPFGAGSHAVSSSVEKLQGTPRAGEDLRDPFVQMGRVERQAQGALELPAAAAAAAAGAAFIQGAEVADELAFGALSRSAEGTAAHKIFNNPLTPQAETLAAIVVLASALGGEEAVARAARATEIVGARSGRVVAEVLAAKSVPRSVGAAATVRVPTARPRLTVSDIRSPEIVTATRGATPAPAAAKREAAVARPVIAGKDLPKFPAELQEAIQASGKLAKRKSTVAASLLEKRVAEGAITGLRPTQANAEKIVSDILSSPSRVRGTERLGQLDVVGESFGQEIAIRVNLRTGQLIGFRKVDF